ncbi:hypothetical protein BU644_07125 [Staphylococcus chromogenes]|uniref:Uncharacterized protein n=1 Tax=Staphylococcus chromogenes TaxID=46126 RepID=A0ABX5I7B2_STACR|nr:hypothetical protein [Staphylococcus chromogenes]KDP13629.1 hypothetical protein SCHR_00620 [Staphylococcus chromogenes MU 970]PTF71510.1 hypothetical protein BU671_02215 [Staphylococcus chromogenes]PTG14517.1 hypothetical protein BU640_03515 [Staphylococcus chromogenes]PTG63424.1 hypothetical protein BU673_03905 [Staphylococcus chromogenes]PTG68364.1 hypothetical protein BU676_10270 [Staphylococcus chromogenes]
MARTSIELITGYTKAGKPQTKKYYAKPMMSLFDTIQGSKLSTRVTKVFKEPDFEELTQEEFEKLSVTEQKEHQAKVDEYQEQVVQQFEIIEEITAFIADGFVNQFTSEELQKGIPAGFEGLTNLINVLEELISGDVDDTKKFVTEKKK